MKRIFVLVLLLPLMGLSQLVGKVVKVKDGDTVVLLDAKLEEHTIRVADIDTPEYRQPYSAAAKKFTSNEIFGATVSIRKKGTDRYGRVIGFVLYDGKNLSAELLKAGLAWHYQKYSSSPHFQELEDLARNKNRVVERA